MQTGSLVQRLEIASWKLRFFRRYARKFLNKNFHTVRLLDTGVTEAIGKLPEGVPVIVVANHPSWWDPMIAIFLAEFLAKERVHYAPIEDVMLEKYGVFKRLGFFGVEKDTVAGLKDFLRVGHHIVQNKNAVIWVTPQGEFADVRKRPIELKSGFSQLASKCDKIAILPLAVEYTFWLEKHPEMLCHMGDAQVYESADAKIIHQQSTEALERAMDVLADASVRRDSEEFKTILSSDSGVGGIYGLWHSITGKGGGHEQ